MHSRIALAVGLAATLLAPSCATTRKASDPVVTPSPATDGDPAAPTEPTEPTEDVESDETGGYDDRNEVDRNGEDECSDSPSEDPTEIDVAIALSNRGLARKFPAEISCESEWTTYRGTLGAIICGTYAYMTTQTSDVRQVPLELVATRLATVTVDGIVYELRGTDQKTDRRDILVDIDKRRATAISEPLARAGKILIDYAIDAPNGRGTGHIAISGEGLFPELAQLGRGPVLLPGETPRGAARATAKGFLFVHGDEINAAYPATLEAKLGDVRYLGRFTTTKPDALCAFGARKAAERQVRLEIFDRFSGQNVVDQALPSVSTDPTCKAEVGLEWPTWVARAYAPELAEVASRLVGRTATPFPTLDPNGPVGVGARAPLARPLGLTQPTLPALLALIGGDRARLAQLLGRPSSASIALDGTNLVKLNIIAASAAWFTANGINDPFIALIGQDRAAVEALLGAPDGKPTPTSPTLSYALARPGVKVVLTVTFAQNRVAGLLFDWQASR